MIRGKFMTSMDDTSPIMALRQRVFVEEQGFSAQLDRDPFDDMAVYALVFDEADQPSGTGRLYIDSSDHFRVGRVCVLKERRGQGLGDLIMRMLLFRAQELEADAVYASAQLEAVGFYEKYGFRPYGAIEMDEGVPHRPLRVLRGEIDIEGSCKKSGKGCEACREDCAACAQAL